MKEDEKSLLLAVEADVTVLLKELGDLLQENTLLYTAFKENTDIPTFMAKLNRNIKELMLRRVVSSDQRSVENIIKKNIEEIFDDDEVDITRLTANIIYDLQKDGYNFVKVEDKEADPTGTGYMVIVPEEPYKEMTVAAALALSKIHDLSETPYVEIINKVWKAMIDASQGDGCSDTKTST